MVNSSCKRCDNSEGVKNEGGLGRVAKRREVWVESTLQLVPLLNLDLDFC